VNITVVGLSVLYVSLIVLRNLLNREEKWKPGHGGVRGGFRGDTLILEFENSSYASLFAQANGLSIEP
jgi:hypothetical protein